MAYVYIPYPRTIFHNTLGEHLCMDHPEFLKMKKDGWFKRGYAPEDEPGYYPEPEKEVVVEDIKEQFSVEPAVVVKAEEPKEKKKAGRPRKV